MVTPFQPLFAFIAIDAANDACVLELLLESRADEILKKSTTPI